MPISTIEELVKKGIKLTPMMEQYFSIKKNYNDTLLFFRMGDFYELFFEDAQKASKILNITLTHRGKLGDLPIPMAGIPHHAANSYIDRLTSQGLKVAICEQTQEASQAKGIVKRAVTQVVSPGLPYDIDKAPGHENHYITAGLFDGRKFYLIALDFTNGDFSGERFDSFHGFIEKLRKLDSKEFISFMGQWEEFPEVSTYLENSSLLVTHLSEEYFSPKVGSTYIKKIVPHLLHDKTIKTQSSVLNPIGALCYYLCSTQDPKELVHLRPFKMESDRGFMRVTVHTLQGLEILPQFRENYKETLLGFMDRTKTASGARHLKKMFLRPLSSVGPIKDRHNIIFYFHGDPSQITFTREILDNVRDIERILAKVSSNRVNPQDVLNISRTVRSFQSLKKELKNFPYEEFSQFEKEGLKSLQSLADRIERSISAEPGASAEKGNLIREGLNKERDKLKLLASNSTKGLEKLEEKYRKKTGVQKLKIKFNNVAGYFVEVSKTHSSKLGEMFIRKQTLVNSERFMTKELKKFEQEVLSSQEKLELLEKELFKSLIKEISECSAELMNMAHILGYIDALQSLAWVALQENFVRPQLKSSKRVVDIKGAFHPLIQSGLTDQFVPHDINLSEERFFGLITGPNMAGKTTVMRELAIIQFLAQVGSFVPAKSANLGLCDQIFSRLGASDNILKGQSTFMVEMTETAEIIRHATSRSLIILDEIGRGTSTYDGLSIAWSLSEFILSKVKAITLFATHYHELIDLTENHPQAMNLTMETQHNGNEVDFLYRLIEGSATQSYGIYVAKLAGLPVEILTTAENMLQKFESEGKLKSGTKAPPKEKSDKEAKESQGPVPGTQLSFFGDEEQIHIPAYLQNLEEELKGLDVLNMTPLQAIKKLHQLKHDLTYQ